jgi:hypothetical protein
LLLLLLLLSRFLGCYRRIGLHHQAAYEQSRQDACNRSG